MTADLRSSLSAAQTEIWLAQALDPTSAIYNVGEIIELPSQLDVPCFERALSQTVDETDALHVRFGTSERGPVQRTGLAPVWTLRREPEPLDPTSLAEELRRDLAQPIDIESEALFRARLLRRADGGSTWSQVYHHIVMDGASRALFAQRVAELYTAFVEAREAPPRGFGTFQDLLDRDDAYRRSDTAEHDRAAWLDELRGLEAPFESMASHGVGTAFHRQGVLLSAEESARLLRFSKESGLGLSACLGAVGAALRATMARAGEVAVGFVVSARADAALRNIPGAVSNIVPLRIAVDPRRSWRHLLEIAKDRIGFALARQRTRIEDMHRDLGLAGKSAELSAVVVNVIPFFGKLRFGAHLATMRNLSNGPVDDFSIVAYPHRDEPRLRIDFNANTRTRSEAELAAFRARFLRLLSAIVADADAPLSSVDLLLDGERALVLERWNATQAPMPRLLPAAWFEAQVAATPDATALVCGELAWTYATLNRRANRIAWSLIGAGLGPEDRVALALSRGADLVAAQLGVLKSGAAYLPIDASPPPARIAAILRDAGVRLVLTDSCNAARLPEAMARLRLDADALSPRESDPGAAGHGRLHPRNAAYAIYTSGSTGVPKGVLVEQAGVSDLVAWAHATYGDALNRVFLTTSLAFDVSVFEILAPLCRGGRIDVLENLLALAEHADDAGPPAMISGVPSALASLLDHAALPPNLSAVVLAGEALPARLVRRLRAARGCRISNVYGPTEATVYATAWHAPEDGDIAAPPIGRPVRNMRVYVLDSALRPLPPGVAGDMYLAGLGLARGYLARPDATAERFVADPFGEPGARMYHTGDVVRWRADGNLDYLGRSDHQVKVRGYRIEPGEIEERLVRHPGVADAVVVPRRTMEGGSRLVAYVVARDRMPEAAALREHLAKSLPDYMVPASFVSIEALPLSANGKLDRAALPAPAEDDSIKEAGPPPATESERTLAAIFAEILDTRAVHRDTNFFHKGGDSLLAIRLIGAIRRSFGIELPIGAVFASPTIARLAQHVDEGPARPAIPAIAAGARPARLPLSGTQRRLWLLGRLEGPRATYNVPIALDLSGPLDRAALRAALAALVARHEILRTVFRIVEDGTPYQEVRPAEALACPLRIVDADDVGIERLLLEENGRPFDLAEESPIRATLFVLDDAAHVLNLAIHHIAIDGSSLPPLLRDLLVAYRARRDGRAPELPPLPLQYADVALAEQGETMSSRETADLDFWREALAGLPHEVTLPPDRPRPAVFDDAGDELDIAIPREMHCALLDLANGNEASLFMVVHAALAATLARLGAGSDVPIGVPVTRRDPALQDVIGCFVNTLVLRADVGGDPSFRALLARVRANDLAAYAHQGLPFERLIEILNPERSLTVNPLFQVMLVFGNPESPIQVPGLAVTRRHVRTGTSKFDLTVLLRDHRDASLAPLGMTGTIEFPTALYERERIAAFRARFLRLLSAIVADADAPLSSVDLLLDGEREVVLERWNATQAEPPRLLPAAWFEAQVAATPEATALVCGPLEWTYAALNRRANRIAWSLIESGLGPEDRVALALARGADLVAAQLGVLKSGAAYLPIDASPPPARIAAILRDADVRLVLTDAHNAARVPEAMPRLRLDADALSPRETDPGEAGHGRLHPRNAAYAIYTSGSTGVPKGVLVEQAGVSDLVAWAHATYGDALNRVFLTTSLAFDVSVFEILAPLCRGGRIDVLENLLALAEHAEDAGPPAMISGVPSALASLLDHAALPPNLSAVVLAGEALPARLVRRLRAARPGCRISNVYGPTEATVYATAWHAPEEGDIAAPPIGRPVRNMRVYVLDSALRPLPPGVAGDMYLAGLGLARGYLARPDATAERFVADPFGEPGARMYLTGDVVRWRADGNLDYLGRSDHQVKVRGYRIEPGEIEERLVRHPDVADAVVVPRRSAEGSRLVAYVVARDRMPEAAELREHLAASLPDYMVPASFVSIVALPLSANGKLDRAALPAPAEDDSTEEAGPPPATESERTLAAIFAEILDTRAVHRDTNFFHQGGDSITSLRLVARARAAGLVFTPRDVFRYQTIGELARVARATSAPIVAAQDLPDGTDLPATPIMRWLAARGASDHFCQAVVLKAPSELNEAGLARLLDDLGARHDALRLVRHADGRLDVLAFEPGRHVESIRTLAGDVDLQAEVAAAARRIEPASGRLLAARIISSSGVSAARVLLVAHHLAADGVTWRVVMDELRDLWDGQGGARRAASFRQWAHGLAAAAHRPDVRAELAYWREVQAAPSLLLASGALVADRDTVATVESHRLRLGVEATQALLVEAPRRLGLRINDLLIAALLIAARGVAGDPAGSLRIDLESHGREDVVPGFDAAQAVGWFTSLFPVLLQAPDDRGTENGLRALLAAVKEGLRRVPRNGVGYGILRYLDADAGENFAVAPTPDVGFNYLGRFDEGRPDLWGPIGDAPAFHVARDPEMALAHAIEVLGRVDATSAGAALCLEWSFAPALVARATVEQLASRWRDAVDAIRALARTRTAPILTPSDVPLVPLSQRDIDEVVERCPAVTDILPLTPLQDGLLFHALHDGPAHDAYTIQILLTLEGAIDAARLARASAALLVRHDALRAAFLADADRPIQVVAGEVALCWEAVDLADAAAAQAWLDADRARGFDPSQPPLIRFALLQTPDALPRLVLTLHHLLVDGWSLPVLRRDLLALYGEAPLGPVVPHKDFLAWLVAQDAEPARTQWRSLLAATPAPTQLFDDRGAGRPASAAAEITLSAAQTAALSGTAARLGVTLPTMVQAAWAMLLARLTGSRDVAFGITLSGRPAELADADRIVGMLINTLPLLVEVRPDTTVRAFCREMQDRFGLLLAAPHMPLAELQRMAGGGTLFDTLVVYENYPGRGAAAESDELRIVAVEGREAAHYPLTLVAVPGATLTLRLLYRSDLIAGSLAIDILGRLQRILEGLTADVERPIGSVAAVAGETAGAIAGPAPAPLWDAVARFADQVARRPEAVAVRQGRETISFAALDAWSAAVAARLAARGVGREHRVALLFERGAPLLAALLGVLKSGAAFVPLDPKNPPDRLRSLAADARVAVVIAGAGVPSLDVAETIVVAEHEQGGFAPPAVHPEQPAYVIFTSGTTGRPKGVVVTRRGLASYAAWACEAYGLGEGGGAAVTTSIAFDATVTSLLLPLLAGEPVTMLDEASQFDRLGDSAGTYSLLKVTPSQLGLIAAACAPERLRALTKSLVVGGEALRGEVIEPWRRLAPGTRIFNEYGPTETVVGCVCREVGPDDPATGTIAIGRPIAGAQVYVLDARLQPAPVGMPGELYIAGDGVARGYLDQAGLTAERFVAVPAGAPGARMYRTGDLVRREDDGTLVYLGRTDAQIKIRGFRIEPAEVESALLTLPSVDEALVVKQGEQRLVGYVVAAALPSDWRMQLAAHLPTHMVPDDLVALDAFPLTRNGKIDHAALPEPGRQIAAFEAPATAAEIALAAILSKLLKVERVAVDDGFFALGGDSILSIQLVGQARRAGYALTPQQVFELQTVRALAAAAVASAGPAPILADAVGSFDATPIMRRLQARGGPIGRYAQSNLFPIPQGIVAARVAAALTALWRVHDILRARLCVDADGTWRLDIPPLAAAEVPPLARIAIDADSRDAVIARTRETLMAALAPEAGRMMRAALLEPDGGDGVLVLCLNHLVSDGVSWQILAKDLEQLLAGEPIAPPPVPFRAVALAESAADDTATAAFWRAQHDPEGALVPGARLDARRDVFSARRVVTTTVPERLTGALLGAVPAAFHGSIDDVFLAAFLIAVERWRAEQGRAGGKLAVDVERHGRGHCDLDLSRTVGWFTIVHPLLLVREPAATPAETLLAVKERRRQVPGDGASHDRLRFGSRDGEGLADGAMPQVLFNYLGRADTLEGFWASADEALPLAHVLTVNVRALGATVGPALHADWSFAPRLLEPAHVERLAQLWEEALAAIAAAAAARTYNSPSDFPLVALSQAQVSDLVQVAPDLVDILPLTPLQAGLLFHARYNEGASSAYVTQLVLELEGGVDDVRLHAAAERLVARHEALRATFVNADDGRILQVLRKSVRPPFDVVGAPAETQDERRAAVRALMARDRAAGFALDRQEPLARFKLVRHGAERSSLLCTFHHVVVDGWSMPTIIDDLIRLHADPEARTAPPSPQRAYFRWLAARDTDAAARAWSDALMSLDEPTRLVGVPVRADGPRRALRRRLPDDLDASLRGLSRQLGVTLATITQTAWAIVLGRLTRKLDVVFGTVVAGRPPEVPGLETSVGLYANTLPLHVAVRQGEAVRDLLRRVQAQQTALLPHHHLGLAEIQRGASLGELFDTLFAFENYPIDRAKLSRPIGGVAVAGLWGEDAAHYPFTIVAVPGATLEFRFSARADLVDGSLVEAIADRYVGLLSDLAARPDAAVGALGRRRHEAMPLAAPLAVKTGIAAAFDRQAAIRGDAVALIDGERRMTYAALAEAANRLAHHLVASGLRPGAPAVVMLPRSAELVVAMLAVLKAGGFYIPLDEALPRERVADIVGEAEVALAVVTTATARSLPNNVRAIALDDPDTVASLSRAPREAPAIAAHPLAPAYVIYTSGSTGRPKGVVVSQANVMRLFSATQQFVFSERDCWTLFHSAAFDFSVWEIWGALLYGGRLVVVPWEVSRDPPRFLRLLADEAVTVLNQTPSAFYQLADAAAASPAVAAHLGLRLVIFGGEALDGARLTGWFAQFGTERPQLVNMYGITETTVHVSQLPLPVETATSGSPIGWPIDDLSVRILDHALQEVPDHVVGDVYVAGGGVSQGYMAQPGLTAERFVADPEGSAGARMYRTGDLAMRLPDGALVYFGRSDHQVKIRGFRIELGEIENRLAKLDGVRQCAVAARQDGAGRRHLVAYAVLAPDARQDAASLKQGLADYLPAYMVPRTIVLLETMPLTRNGKLDRAALPAPDRVSRAASRAPRDARETALCGLFAEVLGIASVGIDDEFFALGGDSLTAMRLIGLLQSRLRIACSIRTLFEHPTVSTLAAACDGGLLATNPLAGLVPLRAGGGGTNLFCVHPGGGLSWVYARLSRYLGADVAIHGLQAAGFADGDILPATIEAMADAYLAAMRSVQASGPYHLLGWSFGGLVAEAIAARLARDGEPQGLVMLLDAYPVPATERRLQVDDAALIDDQMRMIGIEREASEAGALRDALAADQSLRAMLRDRDIDAIVRVTRNNVRMATGWTPPRLAGDLHLFVADAAPPPPFDWSAYVQGRLHRHPIACRHGDMLKPAPLAAICRVIAEAIEDRQTKGAQP